MFCYKSLRRRLEITVAVEEKVEIDISPILHLLIFFLTLFISPSNSSSIPYIHPEILQLLTAQVSRRKLAESGNSTFETESTLEPAMSSIVRSKGVHAI